MKKVFVLFLAVLMIFSLFSCNSTSDAVDEGDSTASSEKINYIGEVNVYNWGEYIDDSVIDEFERQTGIKVNYSTFTSNETMYSVLKTGGSSYDVIFPSDYMVSRLISEDMLEKIDFNNIPNYALIGDEFKNLDCDPNNEYSVPYMWGTVGLIYNTKMVDEEITSWSALFDPKYAGDILMFDNSRDAMGIALKYLGYSQNTTNEAELQEAYLLLKEQKEIVQCYVMDQIFDKLEGGEAAMGPYYAGDYLSMKENNPDLAFVVPEEGSNMYTDFMCIPKGARNKENAEIFINYMCTVDVSVANMDVTGYTTPIPAAWEIYSADLSEEELSVMYPDTELLNRCDVFINLPENILALYDSLWVLLKC